MIILSFCSVGKHNPFIFTVVVVVECSIRHFTKCGSKVRDSYDDTCNSVLFRNVVVAGEPVRAKSSSKMKWNWNLKDNYCFFNYYINLHCGALTSSSSPRRIIIIVVENAGLIFIERELNVFVSYLYGIFVYIKFSKYYLFHILNLHIFIVFATVVTSIIRTQTTGTC